MICITLLLLATLARGEEKATFPSVHAPNLNKQDVQMPAGLSAERNLMLVAFKREQQKEIDTWLKVLPAIAEATPQFAYYEIPVIDKLNPLTRWFVNTGMRSGIPDKAQRGRTVTLYLDKPAFRKALQIASEDRIYVLVINKAGDVLWRVEGPADAEKERGLREFLKTR